MSKMPPRRPQQARIDMAANYEPAFRLLEALPFELSLETGFEWAQPRMARALFGADLPDTFTQFTRRFDTLEPRLSIAALKSLLPGAQRRWEASAARDGKPTDYYELIFERIGESGESGDRFTGVIRDVTLPRRAAMQQEEDRARSASLGSLSGSDFALQLNLLTLLSQTYCPNAASIRFTLKERERLEHLYGQTVKSHVEYEILRRLIVFLPPAAVTAQEGEAIMCLLPDIGRIDPESLSQALTAFPVSTPEGPVNAALNIHIQLLSDVDSAPAPAPKAKQVPAPADISEDDIIGLLNQRSLSLALQPICAAATSEVHHYEALMRVDDPVKGPISAWRHILRAEELDLVHLLDQRALQRAALLLIRYPDLHLALNVSAGTIGDTQKQQDYLAQLDAYPALHSRLGFEMTETMALGQAGLAGQFAERLKQRGCYLSIDDFGAGHTSFETLMVTESRQIKLDGSLIEGVCRSADKQNFVRLMVDFAHTFGVKLVAERVETLQEQRLLTALGVDYLQGYYLGKPISEHEFKGYNPQGAHI